MSILRYGIDSSVHLEPADGAVLVECGHPRGQPLDDLAGAVSDALAEPLEYPSLAQSITPADRIVLALGHGLPQAAEVTTAVIGSLIGAGVGADGITVLKTQTDIDAGLDDPRRLLDESLREKIALVTHDASDRQRLAYLAANDAGEPILLSRGLQGADVVLPIGCLGRETAAGCFGIHDTIYPTFSDERTLARFRSLKLLSARKSPRKSLVAEVDHVAWLLGVCLTIQLVPAAGGSVLHVVAGQSEAVRRKSRNLYAAAWNQPAVPRADLVVAAVEGGADQQGWQNFGRALQSATDLVEDGGAIAVCCDLAAAPGPAMQRMIGARSREDALDDIRREPPADALPAAQFVRTLDRARVYLLSRLNPTVVEGLDMIHVADGDELARLVRQHESCILLANAPHAMVSAHE